MTIHDEFGNTVPSTKHYTPNVVISSPKTRKVVTTILGILGVVLGAAVAFDGATEHVDISDYTTPAAAVLLFVSGSFGLSVTLPNTPTR